YAVLFAEAVLHVISDRIRHEKRSGNFQQRRFLDSLHHAPEMAVAFAEIAERPPSRPGFELHGQGRAFGRFAVWAKLLEQRRERRIKRRSDAAWLGHR